jgi:hypothetical protein
MENERLYIRFGGLPENGKSFAWTSVGDIEREEPGVSVYDAWEDDDGMWHVVMPMPLTERMMNTLWSLVNYQSRRVFLVRGEPAGKGSDNEPCIRNAEIVRDVTEQFKLPKK